MCLFHRNLIKNEYYTPFAYDSVLTIAHLYNDILSKGDVKIIEDGYLEQHLSTFSIVVSKARQEQLSFDAQGDRKVDDLAFSVINLFSKPLRNGTKKLNNALFKQTGKMFGWYI